MTFDTIILLAVKALGAICLVFGLLALASWLVWRVYMEAVGWERMCEAIYALRAKRKKEKENSP